MPDLILEISKSKYLSVSRGHIIVSDDQAEQKVSIEQVLAVLLSADGLTLSKPFLLRMAEENIPVVICGKNYMPMSILTPINAHFMPLPQVEAQLGASAVLKKQLWQSVIKNKIYNQYQVLKFFQPQASVLEKILLLSKKVRSGDVDNKEAQAARLFFPALFGQGFIREVDGEGLNAFLNYGYAVVRACFARAIVACGLLPIFGIKHHNIYNPFCLVDDLMEICRPLVDFHVYQIMFENKELILTPKAKKNLLEFLHFPLLYKNCESYLVPTSIKYVQNFVNCLKNSQGDLDFVELILE